MDPLLQPLLEMGSTGVLVAVVLTGFKYIESRSSKRNGGDLCSRVATLESVVEDQSREISSMRETLNSFHDSFRLFREEVRVTWAKEQAREEVLREIRKDNSASGG